MRLIESTSGTGNYSYVYSGDKTPGTVSFANDGAGNATLVIDGNTMIVKPGECLEIAFEVPFTAVGITTTGAWRMIVGE
jgi:hypothetical protein